MLNQIIQTNTENAIYDPKNPKYWNEISLKNELLRTFDICHGCRMCLHYCPSFPKLFQALDSYADGDVTKISKNDIDEIIRLCYHCKLCYVNCPYTDKDNHIFNLNYAALMQRSVHVKAKKEGVRFQDKILQNSDLAGKLNTGTFSTLVNWGFSSSLHRLVIEKLLGIHKKKQMPKFHKNSFSQWYFKNRKHKQNISDTKKIVLFTTCFVNYNNPELGKDALLVLERNGCEVDYPQQNCCGMPGLNSGDIPFALKKIQSNIESLLSFVEKGYQIAVINPTCSLTLKHEYPLFAGLLGKNQKEQDEWTEKANKIAKATRDISEYLLEIKKSGKFNFSFYSKPEKISYHIPCHLKTQRIGYPARDLIRSIFNIEVQIVPQCCGHDGTWSMKKENFELSLKYGKKAFEDLKEKQTKEIITDCPLAAIQLQQGMNLETLPQHPVQIIAKAYKKPEEGGFPHLYIEKGG